jgi:hypothetical protein
MISGGLKEEKDLTLRLHPMKCVLQRIRNGGFRVSACERRDPAKDTRYDLKRDKKILHSH